MPAITDVSLSEVMTPKGTGAEMVKYCRALPPPFHWSSRKYEPGVAVMDVV